MGRGRFYYDKERAEDLLRAYRSVLAQAEYIELEEVVAKTVNTSARRFWVSDEVAIRHVRRLLRGECVRVVGACRVAMYDEILRRVVVLRALHPRLSIAAAVRRVVRAPAPRFYLTVGTARTYLAQYRQWQRGARKGLCGE